MKVRIRYNCWYPRCIGFRGTVFYPYVLISTSRVEAKKKRILHHEWIHIQQIRREGFLNFYCKYISEWLFNFIKYGNMSKAYKNISYEKEAYANEKTFKLPKNLQ